MARVKYYDPKTEKWEYADANVGIPGAPGASPTISLEPYEDSFGKGLMVTVNNPDGSVESYTIPDGKDGENGSSAFVSVTKSGNVATVTTRDVTGTRTVEVYDGEDYVLTEDDKNEIAELAAGMVDVPDSGGNAGITLVGSAVAEEAVTAFVFPMGEHKIVSDNQRLFIQMYIPANANATGELHPVIFFNSNGILSKQEIILYRCQSAGAGSIPKGSNVFCLFETSFFGKVQRTTLDRNGYSSMGYPIQAFSSVSQISNIGSTSYDYLIVKINNPDSYPGFQIGTEVYVYVE